MRYALIVNEILINLIRFVKYNANADKLHTKRTRSTLTKRTRHKRRRGREGGAGEWGEGG